MPRHSSFRPISAKNENSAIEGVYDDADIVHSSKISLFAPFKRQRQHAGKIGTPPPWLSQTPIISSNRAAITLHSACRLNVRILIGCRSKTKSRLYSSSIVGYTRIPVVS